jgi:hypothetical protein
LLFNSSSGKEPLHYSAKVALSNTKEEQIREKLADRSFTPNERAAMIRMLSSSPKIKLRIRYLTTEPEAGRFAKIIHGVFVEAGWNPETPNFQRRCLSRRLPVPDEFWRRTGDPSSAAI